MIYVKWHLIMEEANLIMIKKCLFWLLFIEIGSHYNPILNWKLVSNRDLQNCNFSDILPKNIIRNCPFNLAEFWISHPNKTCINACILKVLRKVPKWSVRYWGWVVEQFVNGNFMYYIPLLTLWKASFSHDTERSRLHAKVQGQI